MKKINYRLQSNRKQQGIGLLELMLALAIIAILLVMATRYYMSASLESRVNQAADALNSLPAAGECWASSSNSAANGTYSGVGDHLYTISTTEQCYPTSLVSGTADPGKLILPYGAMTVSDTSYSICVNGIKTGTEEETNQLIQKICKGQGITVSGDSSGFSYEAIHQICKTGDQCSTAK